MNTRFGEIDERIIGILGLSENERVVFGALLQQTLARNVSQVARMAGLSRSTTRDILIRLEKRKLVFGLWSGKRFSWRYKISLEKLKWRGDDI